MGRFIQDLRYGLRQLRRYPGFTAVAVVTLGLGIGANSVIFSVVDAVLLRPLPYRQPSQLIELRESSAQFPMMSVAFPDYYDWRHQNRVFSSLAAYRGNGFTLTGVGEPEALEGAMVTANLFPMLGVRPLLGRYFTEDEDKPGGLRVAILSYAFWQQRFGGDKKWLGHAITLDAKSYVVVGIMPPGFDFPEGRQLWTPLGPLMSQSSIRDRDDHPGISGLGRLKPGVTLRQAQAEMGAIALRLAHAYPKSNSGETVRLLPYLQWTVRGYQSALWTLLLAAGFVLLIACANIANLLLARAAGRRKEFAIRAALGANKRQVATQVLVESVMLALAGGVAGLLLGAVGIHLVVPLLPKDLPRAHSLGLDWRVLGFTFGAAVVCGILFGLAPAWQQREAGVAEALKEGGRETHGLGARRRLRGTLVAAEMALALVLLAGAGLLLRSFYLLLRASPGFNPRHVLTFDVGLPEARYPKDPQQVQFFRRVLAGMANLPGVSHAGTTGMLPFSGSDWENSFQIVGRAPFPPGHVPDADYEPVSPDYFQAMQIPLLAGRYFTERDNAKSPPVVIIDHTFAAKYWPNGGALGAQISRGGKPVTIVGIVPHIKLEGMEGNEFIDRLPEMWTPLYQNADDYQSFIIRVAGGLNPLALLTQAVAQVHTQDSSLAVTDVYSMEQLIRRAMAPRRLSLALVGLFGALALLLAAIGIYAVMSYLVTERRHEIGIRMALGAQQGQVRTMVMRDGLRWAGLGAVVGLILALSLGQVLRGFLFGVAPSDPATLVIITALLFGVAALACYFPARRATKIDPMEALRYE
jgi:putative ABC transport system permease protein